MRIFLLLLVAWLSGCATSPETLNTLWEWSIVGIPDDASDVYRCQGVDIRVGMQDNQECFDQINGPRPLIVFMHGCSGPNPHYVRFFRKLGYVVVAPNSLIRHRSAACPTNLQVVSLRLEEVALILERTKDWKWVDRSRMVLAGFSEGAVTTAHYAGDEFKARIVMAWTCRSGSFAWEGIRGKNNPVLAVVGDSDHWYVGTLNAGDCGFEMNGRPSSRSVVLSGVGHDVILAGSSNPEFRPDVEVAVSEFLKTVLR